MPRKLTPAEKQSRRVGAFESAVLRAVGDIAVDHYGVPLMQAMLMASNVATAAGQEYAAWLERDKSVPAV